MTDERLIAGLSAWLQDSEIAPPDARMSAGRVMAGVESTSQLRRWWPPARLVRRVLPMPALGAGPGPRPLPPPPAPRTTKGVRSRFTAVRVLAVAIVFALVGTSLLLVPRLLGDPVEPVPVASPTPSASVAAPTAAPSPTPGPSPSASPDPGPVATTAESTFAATRMLTPFAEGSLPKSLSSGPQKTALYVDDATRSAYLVAADGYRHTLATEGHKMLDWTLGAPHAITQGGDRVVIQDADGLIWIWADNYEQAPHMLTDERTGTPPSAPIVIEPAIVPIETVTRNSHTYDIHAIDPASGDVIYQRGVGYDQWDPPRRASREGRPAALGLYADPLLHVLTDSGVERYKDGQPREGLTLEAPPGEPPQYRFIDGIGNDGKGQLWLYDARGARMVVFDKLDGGYLGSWAPGPSEPGMGDVRGVFVEGDGSGEAALVTWVTPAGLMQSAVSDASLVAADGPRAGTHDGRLIPSDRAAGPRAFEWSAGPLRLEVDALRLKANGKVFRAQGEVAVDNDSYFHDADLELEWFEGGIRQRLYIQLSSNDTHWWIREIWAYDGLKDGDWVRFEDLESLTRTPVGESLEGDLRIGNTDAERARFQEEGSARLAIDGMRLTAFRPADMPAPLAGCDSPTEEAFIIGPLPKGADRERLGDSPLVPLVEMTPVEAEAALQELGLCYRFSYEWPREPYKSKQLDRFAGDWDHETRCSAPAHGAITGIMVLEDSTSNDRRRIVRVSVKDNASRDLPEPPPYGTDCEPLDAS